MCEEKLRMDSKSSIFKSNVGFSFISHELLGMTLYVRVSREREHALLPDLMTAPEMLP